MSSFRNSRLPLPLLVACAAFALSGCMQSTGPTAKAQARGDLDALAYGELQPTAPKAEQGFFSSRAVANNTTTTSKPVAAGNAPALRVATADATSSQPPKTVREPAKFGGGLFAALGAQMQSATPGPMQSNAQIADPQVMVVQAPVVQAPVAQAAVVQAPAMRVPVAYPAPVVMTSDPDYRMDAGDKLRVVVFGQEGLTNTYAIDAGGGITMPLIGRVVARGMTPAGLAAHVTARLRKGYIRDPSVAVEVEAYRPFFILGEVAAPGQYPYVPNMSVEAAVAIAGGFSPRARRDSVILTQKVGGGQARTAVPLGTPLSPGDTIMVGERWF